MPAPRPFVLTAAQRQELERTSRTDARAYLRERCAALLKRADGWSQRRVAQQGLLHPRRPETIAAWRTRYEAGGLAG